MQPVVTIAPGERKRLENYQPLTTLPIGGVGHMVAGLLLLAAGAAVIARVMVDPSVGSMTVPAWIVVDVGCLLMSMGLWFVCGGTIRIFRQSRRSRGKREHPSQPWLWDQTWNREGAAPGVIGPTIGDILCMIVTTGLVAPFTLLPHDVPTTVVWILDAIVVAGWLSTVYRAIQRLKYRHCQLRFQTFPFFLGSHLHVLLPLGRAFAGFERLTCTLRCVEEVVESTLVGSGGSRRQEISAAGDGLYEVQQVFTPEEIGQQPEELRLDLRLPEGDFGSRFSGTGPRYWQLEIKAPTPGINYSATFLVPVYAG